VNAFQKENAMKLHSSTVLVTGANRGLGHALVTSFLGAGARRVYAAARNLRALDALVARDRERIVPLRLDVTSGADVEAAARSAADVNVLVNNAGVLASFDLLTASEAQVRQDFETNFFGALALTRAFVPQLERAKGAIVNVLTVASLASRPMLGGYAASKAAAYSATQALRAALQPRGIQVHAVFPGAIDTDMIRAFPIPKTSAADVANGIVAGIERGDEDILPDPMASDVYARWRKDPRAFEQWFGAL
jgi:NAD(P)-dependent dehydrogenase (short-subunit alcohol dehydrogenase family)